MVAFINDAVGLTGGLEALLDGGGGADEGLVLY